MTRLILAFAAFLVTGLFALETNRNRRLIARQLEEAERETEVRRQAELQLKSVIESSPASILILDGQGSVLVANESAHRLLGLSSGALEGTGIANHLPALASVPATGPRSPRFRTSMECHGVRLDGEVFLAQIWFSTYQTASGPRLAAMVFDTSEGLRNREDFSLRQLLEGSQILVSAVCHEIRNACGAIGAVHAKVARNPAFAADPDFQTLQSLVSALGRLSGFELRRRQEDIEPVDLRQTLEELRIVIEQRFLESNIGVHWEIEPDLPKVWADPAALLQVFLNLANNAERALQDFPGDRSLTVRAGAGPEGATVTFRDTGPGVANPTALFQPFQPGADENGLGLYLSRAFLHRYGGELAYQSEGRGACFVVTLQSASPGRRAWEEHDRENRLTDTRRSLAVPR